MDPNACRLLSGTLAYTKEQSPFTSNVFNDLPVPVQVDYVTNMGVRPTSYSGFPCTVGPGQTVKISGGGAGGPPAGFYKATVEATGALVAVFELSLSAPDVKLDWTVLSSPNDIGPIPIPTASVKDSSVEPQPGVPRVNSTIIVPPDGARILVGCGIAPNLNVVLREQYWARQNDSICLAGGESKTVSYTVSSGTQQTSSSESTIAASIGGSVGAGWGPISASLSSSLSRNSSVFQQVVTSQEVVSYVSTKIHNRHDEPIAFLRWQLTEVITILDVTQKLAPVASVIQVQNPTVVMGPYWISPRSKPDTSLGAPLFTYESA